MQSSAPYGHGAPWPCPGATLPIALVWRQARKAEWTTELDGKNVEERKCQKGEQYQFVGFAFQNILEGRRYLF